MILKLLRDFLKREDGQALGLFALVSLGLVVAILFIYNLGDFFIFWIREQNALDAAALSGAVVQADNLNTIVEYNKSLIYSYASLISICWASYAIPPWTGVLCPFTTTAMEFLENSIKIFQLGLRDGTSVLAFAAARDSYSASGGRSTLVPGGSFSLKMKEVYSRIPKTWPFRWMKTYCGLSEEGPGDSYDWSGGRRDNEKGSYKGHYDKSGPGIDLHISATYKPVVWFPKKVYTFRLQSTARPYGGTVEPINFFIFGRIGWGNGNFIAKLVPYGQ